jgi:hypothetical protein
VDPNPLTVPDPHRSCTEVEGLTPTDWGALSRRTEKKKAHFLAVKGRSGGYAKADLAHGTLLDKVAGISVDQTPEPTGVLCALCPDCARVAP